MDTFRAVNQGVRVVQAVQAVQAVLRGALVLLESGEPGPKVERVEQVERVERVCQGKAVQPERVAGRLANNDVLPLPHWPVPVTAPASRIAWLL